MSDRLSSRQNTVVCTSSAARGTDVPVDLPEGEHRPAVPAEAATSSTRFSAMTPEEDRPADVRQVGVGPWPGGPEAWPTDPRYDRELLAAGDRRNVVDRYRYWTIAAIRADLAARAHRLHIAIELSLIHI